MWLHKEKEKNDDSDISEILLKVALNTITVTQVEGRLKINWIIQFTQKTAKTVLISQYITIPTRLIKIHDLHPGNNEKLTGTMLF